MRLVVSLAIASFGFVWLVLTVATGITQGEGHGVMFWAALATLALIAVALGRWARSNLRALIRSSPTHRHLLVRMLKAALYGVLSGAFLGNLIGESVLDASDAVRSGLWGLGAAFGLWGELG